MNRDFDAVRYQPTAIVIISSPTAVPGLAAAVKKEWAGLTPKRHKAALIADFLTPDSDDAGSEPANGWLIIIPKRWNRWP